MLNNILKVLIGFFLLSFTVFLIIGIPKTTHTLETSIFIDAPVEEVYSFVSDISNGEKWINGFISIEKARGDGLAVGNSYNLSVMEFGKVIEVKETITELEPNAKMGFDIAKKGVKENVSIIFENKDGGTNVKEIHTIKGQGFVSRFIIKVFKKNIHNDIITNYENLKKVIEKN